MSDDVNVDEVDDLDDPFADEGDELVTADDVLGEAGSAALGDDDLGFDDEDDEDDDDLPEELDPAAALDATGDTDDEAGAEPAVDLAVIEGLEPSPVRDEQDDEGLRDGEFVCRSCHMARRASALADQEQMLCRDCA